jgi:hypothetical protein
MNKRVDRSDVRRAQIQRNTTESDWEVARSAAADLEQVQGRQLHASEISRLQKKWGVSRATVWRRVGRFRKDGDLIALVNRKRGLKTGSSLLSADVDFAIQESARRLWAISENVTVVEPQWRYTRELGALLLNYFPKSAWNRHALSTRNGPEQLRVL